MPTRRAFSRDPRAQRPEPRRSRGRPVRRRDAPAISGGAIGLAAAARLTLAVLAVASALPAAADDGGVGFARFLVEHGLPAEGARELNRLALAGAAGDPLADAASEAAAALLRAGDPAGAARALSLAADHTVDPERADRRRLQLAVALVRARDRPFALHELSRLEAFGASAETRARARHLGCIAHVLAYDAALARACVPEVLGGSRRLASAGALLGRLEIDPEWRGRIGGALSAALPGLGQLTAGETGDAALALLVNGGWIGASIALGVERLWVDLGLLTVGVASRYYVGNVEHGSRAWKRAAERRRGEAARELARMLGEEPVRVEGASSAPDPTSPQADPVAASGP